MSNAGKLLQGAFTRVLNLHQQVINHYQLLFIVSLAENQNLAPQEYIQLPHSRCALIHSSGFSSTPLSVSFYLLFLSIVHSGLPTSCSFSLLEPLSLIIAVLNTTLNWGKMIFCACKSCSSHSGIWTEIQVSPGHPWIYSSCQHVLLCTF